MKPLSLTFMAACILLSLSVDARADQTELTKAAPHPSQAVKTATSPLTDANIANMSLRIEASKKLTEATLAQFDGDASKMNTALTDAIAIYNKIIEMVPADTQTLNARAIAKNMLQKGEGKADIDTVIKLTTDIISKDAAAADAFHDRAVAHRSTQNFNEARKDFQTAIALKPEKTWWATELRAMEAEAK